MTWQASWRVTGRTAAVIVIGMGGLLVLGLALAGAGISGGSMLFAAGQGCGNTGAVVTAAVQPAPSKASILSGSALAAPVAAASWSAPAVVPSTASAVFADAARGRPPGK